MKEQKLVSQKSLVKFPNYNICHCLLNIQVYPLIS